MDCKMYEITTCDGTQVLALCGVQSFTVHPKILTVLCSGVPTAFTEDNLVSIPWDALSPAFNRMTTGWVGACIAGTYYLARTFKDGTHEEKVIATQHTYEGI